MGKPSLCRIYLKRGVAEKSWSNVAIKATTETKLATCTSNPIYPELISKSYTDVSFACKNIYCFLLNGIDRVLKGKL